MTDNTSSFNMSTAVRAMDGAISRMVQSVLSAPANLAAELDRFQRVRAQTLAMLGELTEAQAMWSPRPGVWSAEQIADHLLRSEDIYRDQFQRVIRLSQEGKGTSVQVSLRDMDMSPAIIPREILPLFETPLRIFNYFVPAVLRETCALPGRAGAESESLRTPCRARSGQPAGSPGRRCARHGGTFPAATACQCGKAHH